MFSERDYRRDLHTGAMEAYEVKEGESDLFICTPVRLYDEALKSLREARAEIGACIRENPLFHTSLSPLPFDPEAPHIVQDMLAAAIKADVGPMAAVAGAVAEHVGLHLATFSDDVIVENGGDIYMSSPSAKTVSIFTDNVNFAAKLKLRISPLQMPCGVCTSSGVIGPSLSFGKADAVTVISPSASLADGAATALGNIVKTEDDIEKALKRAQSIEGVTGVVIVIGRRMGAWGPAVELA